VGPRFVKLTATHTEQEYGRSREPRRGHTRKRTGSGTRRPKRRNATSQPHPGAGPTTTCDTPSLSRTVISHTARGTHIKTEDMAGSTWPCWSPLTGCLHNKAHHWSLVPTPPTGTSLMANLSFPSCRFPGGQTREKFRATGRTFNSTASVKRHPIGACKRLLYLNSSWL